ncbi:MAG: tRNA (cytidine(34)-2'-O)-methyltransferase [Burkholderiales bacterium]
MFDIILFEPEIAPNTGNVIRLCANTGARLHLVRPLGFSLRDKQLLRAGLDYHDLADITVHTDWEACTDHFDDHTLYAFSTRGTARYDRCDYRPGDGLVFGPETRGLPEAVLTGFPPQRRMRIPMAATSRSINLSNAVAIVIYEAWRQNGFCTKS